MTNSRFSTALREPAREAIESLGQADVVVASHAIKAPPRWRMSFKPSQKASKPIIRMQNP
jgi:hypothetical protein